MLAAIFEARAINQHSGGAVVAPWDLDRLPDEWREAFLALNGIQAAAREKQRVEGLFEAFRQKHPTYGKY